MTIIIILALGPDAQQGCQFSPSLLLLNLYRYYSLTHPWNRLCDILDLMECLSRLDGVSDNFYLQFNIF